VISSDDPVRVFQDFATLDLLSGGRAEIMAGRGSFIESFPLFGYALADYERLFEEKLQLFAELLQGGPVTWSGTTRAALTEQTVYPPLESGTLPTWIAVGGTPQSVVRAAHYGFSLMLAIIGGQPMQFAPFVELYHRALAEFGHGSRPVGVHSHGHVARSDREAIDELWPHYAESHARIGSERGWPAMSREQFEAACGPEGALFVGSPESMAAKIVALARALGLARFDMKYSAGTLPHSLMLKCIELYGSQVAPLVRAELAASRV
jgi:alkanesulfonate monooxygenase SsuD/methylene tetrahydromethanopterin reductase-like flavin-dependent oxidoreductase (luciferase family)